MKSTVTPLPREPRLIEQDLRLGMHGVASGGEKWDEETALRIRDGRVRSLRRSDGDGDTREHEPLCVNDLPADGACRRFLRQRWMCREHQHRDGNYYCPG